MINNKKLTLSIVIPVFNEEDYLSSCLNSIAVQSEMPDEVIVVDNNSTDGSMEIAKRYPFVKIIHEPKQHQSFAQKTGFDAAIGDIIGRIDADSVLPNDWSYKIKQVFTAQPKTVAITGNAWPYDVQLKQLAVIVFGFYNKMASLIAGSRMLWGSNCALRKTAWQQIRSQALLRNDIWEDYDISILLSSHGNIRYQPKIGVAASFRAVHKSFFTQLSYQFRSVRTFYLHKGILRATGLFLLWYTMILLYPIVLLDEYVLKPPSQLKERRHEVLESPALVD